MFRERVTQTEILHQLREILGQLAAIRATVDTLPTTQSRILARCSDNEAHGREEVILEEISTIRDNMFQELLDRMDQLLGRVHQETRG